MGDPAPRLLVVPAFLGAHGGLENHVLSHVRIAAQEGYHVTVVTPRPLPPDGEAGPLLAEWADLDDAERHWRATPASRSMRAAAGLKALVRERGRLPPERRATLALDRARPYIDRFWPGPGHDLLAGADLVHAFGKPKAFVCRAVVAAAAAGVPVLYTEIAEVTEAYASRPDLRGFRGVANRCDHVVVMSEGQGDDVRRRFGYRGPLTVIEQWADGVEAPLLAIERTPERETRPDHEGSLVVGSLCRLSPEKGLDVLLRAFAPVARAHSGVTLALAGTGALEGPLRQLAADLGIEERVEFRGFVADRVAFYRDLDVFAVCSLEEGGPITAVEAMAAGLPLISTGCGAMPDRVRDGREGRRVAAGDVDGLTRALSDLVGAPSTRAAMGRAARQRYLERCSERTNGERLVQLWRALRRGPTTPAHPTRAAPGQGHRDVGVAP